MIGWIIISIICLFPFIYPFIYDYTSHKDYKKAVEEGKFGGTYRQWIRIGYKPADSWDNN